MLNITQVDSFSSEAFRGNPAAVVILTERRPDEWMKKVAAEMNLAETAFLLKEENGQYRLRWFTPTVEVALCGHATLATAHVLWEEGYLKPEAIATFQTLSGEVSAQRDGEWIVLDFPVDEWVDMPIPSELVKALGPTDPIYVGKRKSHGILVQYASAAEVHTLQPNHSALKALEYEAIVVTAQDNGQPYDFVSRFFGPHIGIEEDPVTGAAHTCLTPFWAKQLKKEKFLAHQASARGGDLRLELNGSRVKIAGQAVTVMRGEWLV